MDQQKTGQLIAQRRKELNMTQKMLAEKLSISDRAVSKWERGAGFPDVSLIEALADALQLTLPELFQGEQCPAPLVEDTSAREVLHFTLHKIRRHRRIILVLCVLLTLLASVLLFSTLRNRGWQQERRISPETAVSIAPEILITTDDYNLIDVILSDPVLGSHYEPFPLWKESTGHRLENEEARAFTDYFDDLGQELQYACIDIGGSSLTVIYATSSTSVYLTYTKDTLRKTVVTSEHPIWDAAGQLIPMEQRHGDRIDLRNENNEAFYQSGYTASWLERLGLIY